MLNDKLNLANRKRKHHKMVRGNNNYELRVRIGIEALQLKRYRNAISEIDEQIHDKLRCNVNKKKVKDILNEFIITTMIISLTA